MTVILQYNEFIILLLTKLQYYHNLVFMFCNIDKAWL